MEIHFILILMVTAFVSCQNDDCWSNVDDSGRGALHNYVFCEDDTYSWEVIETYTLPGYTCYIINMTSQTWYDESTHSRPVWWHYLGVNVPDDIVYPDNGFLYISTGNNNDGIPNYDSRHIGETGQYANNTGIVTAALRQIPNQPIEFTYNHNNINFTRERVEDDIIAWTWREFIEDTSDPNILLRWPMCKATARAMDTMTAFLRQLRGNEITDFMIAGESKRGWTTWLHGAIDDRVVAMAPVVLSCLNLQTIMKHYYTSLGGWPLAFGNYYVENMTSYMDTPEVAELERYVDPYSSVYLPYYADKPKLIVSGASDEFFFMDDYWYWYNDMPEPKYMWLLEKSSHSISGSPLNADYWRMLETFYISVMEEYTMPTFSWTRTSNNETGSITVFVEEPDKLLNIEGWAYLSPLDVYPRRDFRRYAGIPPQEIPIEDIWEQKTVQDMGNGFYMLEMDVPPPPANVSELENEYEMQCLMDDEGGLIPERIESCSTQFQAFFIKLTFEGPTTDRPYIFSTEAQIIPDCMPFESCEGPDCFGILR